MEKTDQFTFELAEKMLNFAKKLFKEYSGITLEYARELIELEDRIKALKQPQIKTDNTPKKVETTEKQTILPPQEQQSPFDNDDLPF